MSGLAPAELYVDETNAGQAARMDATDEGGGMPPARGVLDEGDLRDIRLSCRRKQVGI